MRFVCFVSLAAVLITGVDATASPARPASIQGRVHLAPEIGVRDTVVYIKKATTSLPARRWAIEPTHAIPVLAVVGDTIELPLGSEVYPVLPPSAPLSLVERAGNPRIGGQIGAQRGRGDEPQSGVAGE